MKPVKHLWKVATATNMLSFRCTKDNLQHYECYGRTVAVQPHTSVTIDIDLWHGIKGQFYFDKLLINNTEITDSCKSDLHQTHTLPFYTITLFNDSDKEQKFDIWCLFIGDM